MQSVVFSSKPGKQRKAYYTRQLHQLKKDLSVHVSRDIRKEIGKRAIGIRKDDKVKIMRGKFSGKQGKIVAVNMRKKTVFIEGITRKKANGKEAFIPFRASKLLLVDFYSKDKKRFKGRALVKASEKEQKKEADKDKDKGKAKKEESKKSFEKRAGE